MMHAETRLSVRLQGPLAAHVNRRIDSALYSSHSEYIRDLVRRDMTHEDGDDALSASLSRGLADIEHGRYRKWDSKEFHKEVLAAAKSRRKK